MFKDGLVMYLQKELCKSFLNFILLKLKSPIAIFQVKGSDRLCKVVKLNMQCCGKLLSDSFETY